jgi:hypothetical protein
MPWEPRCGWKGKTSSSHIKQQNSCQEIWTIQDNQRSISSGVSTRITSDMGNTWHTVFHSALLLPYHKTAAHGPNFSWPLPDLIEGEVEYKVKQIWNHQYFGCSCTLQYLIKWKGYLECDNIWEPADNIHTPDLLKAYNRKHIKVGVADPLNAIICSLQTSHSGTSWSVHSSLLSTIHHAQVPQFCPWSLLPSDSYLHSQASSLLLWSIPQVPQWLQCQASVCPTPRPPMCHISPHPLYPST